MTADELTAARSRIAAYERCHRLAAALDRLGRPARPGRPEAGDHAAANAAAFAAAVATQREAIDATELFRLAEFDPTGLLDDLRPVILEHARRLREHAAGL